METIKSISEERLIIRALLNGKEACLMLDTGASVGIINRSEVRAYNLAVGRSYPGTLRGAGGRLQARCCDTFAYVEGRAVPQFLLADISGVVESIRQETGVTIQGLISLPQMRMAGMRIDTDDNTITIK